MNNKVKELILTANLIDVILSEDTGPEAQAKRALLKTFTHLDLNNFTKSHLILMEPMIEMMKLFYLQFGKGKARKVFNTFYKVSQSLLFRLDDWNLNRELTGRMAKIYEELCNMSSDELKNQVDILQKERNIFEYRSSLVFIGHGRNSIWNKVDSFIKNELKVSAFNYESESRISESIVNILNSFLVKATFAVLIFTGEDETSQGMLRARQNVIHEAGLFQGRLGFDKVVLLKQDKVENLSNLAGLQYISFSGENIEETYTELTRSFKKNELI